MAIRWLKLLGTAFRLACPRQVTFCARQPYSRGEEMHGFQLARLIKFYRGEVVTPSVTHSGVMDDINAP